MKSVFLAAACAIGLASLGGSAQAQCVQTSFGCVSPNNWGLMNYGVPYANDPYAETSGNFAAYGGSGLYGSAASGPTAHTQGGQGLWGNVMGHRYDSKGRLILTPFR